MIQKYYIPTTTLNLNNILSSESISPKAFYAARGFGYSSWESIPENDVDNAIILYGQPFGFARPDRGLEDYPLLIEILTEEQFPSVRTGVFYCDHTLYLSIGGTRFIFFSEQDKRVTLSRLENAVETKYYEWVWGKYMVVSHFLNVERKTIQLEVGLNQKAIEKDYRINKMKGLLYGFFIGKVLSCSLEDVYQLNILRKLQDIASECLSSQCIPTLSQTKQVYELLKDYQKYTLSGRFLQELNTDWEKVYETVITLISFGAKIPELFDVHKLMGDFRLTSRNHPFIHWLEEEHKKKEKWFDIEISEEEKYRNRFIDGDYELLEPENEEIIVEDLCLSKIKVFDERDSTEQYIQNVELLKGLVNDTLLQKKYHRNPAANMADLSDEIAIKAKEVYKDLWEYANVKQTLSEMRKYVRMQDSNFIWGEILTSSITAVIVKGYDWRILLTFMQEKGMCDYRLAFAFYGELQGFANLDRIFTQHFYSLYWDDVYQDFYFQLLGVYPIVDVDERDVEINYENAETSLCIQWQSWQDKLRDIISQERIVKTNKKASMRDLENAIKRNGSNNDIKKFMDLLLTYNSWHRKEGRPNAAWERLKEHIDFYYADGNNW